MGYNTVTLKPGFNLLAINFKNLGTEDQTISLNELFTGGSTAAFTAGSSIPKADTIQVWDGSGYSYYFMYKQAKGSGDKDYKWVDGSVNVTDKTFKNGDSFWFLSRAESDVVVTVSGLVEVAAKKTIDILPGYNMIGSFFPAGLALNDDTYYTPTYWQNSGAVAGSSIPKADTIQVWDGSGYTYYFLYKQAKGSGDKDYKWVDGSVNVYTDPILLPGKGAWYLHRGNGMTLEIKSPL